MNTRRRRSGAKQTMRLRVLLVALTATSCYLISAQVAASTNLLDAPTITTTTTTAAQTQQPSSPSVIGGLLRDQLTRRTEVPQTTTTTTTTATLARERAQLASATVPPTTSTSSSVPTTPENQVPSLLQQSSSSPPQKPASQQLAQQQQQVTTTTTTTATATRSPQVQYVKPVSSLQQQQQQQQQPQPTSTTKLPTPPVQAPTCQYNNRTYAIGQSWNDDCIQVCKCVSSGASGAAELAISACVPRCPAYKDAPSSNCKLLRSKTDQCCLEFVCEPERELTAASLQSSGGSATTTTIVTTDRGSLRMSTTEIRMPTTTTTPIAAATTTTTTTVATPTTSAETTVAPMTSSAQTTTISTPTSTPAAVAAAAAAAVRGTTRPVPSALLSFAPVATSVLPQSNLRPNQGRSRGLPTTTTTTTTTTSSQQVQTTSTPASTTMPTTKVTAATVPSTTQASASGSGGSRRPQSAMREPKQVAPLLASQATRSSFGVSSSRPQRGPSPPSGDSSGAPNLADMTRSASVSSAAPILSPPHSGLQDLPDDGVVVDSLRDIDQQDLCIVSDSLAWKIHSTWLDESRCNMPCRCAFRDDAIHELDDLLVQPALNIKPATTEIRCGLTPKCAHLRLQLLVRSPECPAPRLDFGPSLENSCACPKIVCELPAPPSSQPGVEANGRSSNATSTAPAVVAQSQPPAQPTTATTTTTTTTIPETGGTVGGGCKTRAGKLLAPNETYNDECHSTCRCSPTDGEIHCEPLTCPSEPAADHLCAEWTIADEPNSSDAKKCCPEFVCKLPIESSSSSSSSTSSPPLSSTSTSTNVPEAAPASQVDDGSQMARNNENASSSTSSAAGQPPLKACHLLGMELKHNERVPEQIQPRGASGNDGLALDLTAAAAADTCERMCICQDGQIVCTPECQPHGDSPPSDFECPPGLAYLITADCCPKWTCQIEEGYDLQDIQVNSVNATTIEIVIKLPEFALNHRGKLELNFTYLPLDNPDSLNDEPPPYAKWNRRPSIRTPDGTFPSPIIKYYWSNLKPNHKFWFKLLVRFDDGPAAMPPFDTPLESAIQSFRMAPLQPAPSSTANPNGDALDESPTSPIAATTTTATTSTTVKSFRPSQQATTTTTTTTTPAPTRIITPHVPTRSTKAPMTAVPSTIRATATPAKITTTTTSTTTTTTSTTTTSRPSSTLITKPDILGQDQSSTPCAEQPSGHDTNKIDDATNVEAKFSVPMPSSWAETWKQQVQNAPIRHYAWHLLVAFSVMTILFTIVSYLYLKKSSRMIAPITQPYQYHHGNHHQSAYDNPTFTTKLVSYNANQPRVLLIDESYQNLDNLAKQKNMEVDKSSPLHNNHHKNNGNHLNHTAPNLQHQNNGRQHLI